MLPGRLRGFQEKIIQSLPSVLVPDDVPDRLAVRPVDMWAGDEAIGRDLCAGLFTLDGENLELHGGCWEPAVASQRWLDYLHGFRWLRDLRAVGGAAARQQAQALIESWAGQYAKPSAFAWRPDLVGERLSLWVSHYDFFGADQIYDFDDWFFKSLHRQARYLLRSLGQVDIASIAALRTTKGLIYVSLAFEGYGEWLNKALEHLQSVVDAQVLLDGFHVSRSAFDGVQGLKILLEIRSALQAGGHDVPDFLQQAAQRMVPAIRFVRYGDRHFGLFQGALDGDLEFVDAVLAQAGVRGKKINSLPDGGYEKAVLGRSLLMCDVGGSGAHAAPLSFEMAYGKDRIFVNCGTHEFDQQWQDVLSVPAAHNTVTIDGAPMARRYSVEGIKREESQDFCYLHATHNAFLTSHGVRHKRSFYLCDDGHDLRGEDLFTAMSSDGGPVHPQMMNIRFHLHPRVMVSLTQDGQAALLRLRSGVGWRFQQVGGFRLRLEDSVYAGELGQPPRKTHQLVIESAIAQDQQELSIKWALRREGL